MNACNITYCMHAFNPKICINVTTIFTPICRISEVRVTTSNGV